MPEIKVENLNKSFGKNQILDQVSFSVDHGKCVAIVGTNGKGKTTLMNLLAGLFNPNSGSIFYGGQNLSKHRSEIQKKSAYLPEYPELVSSLTVKENILLLAKLKGLKVDNVILDKLVQQFQIEAILNTKIKNASQGAIYKTALARAIICKPQYLLLDEPNAAIDNDTLLTIKKLLKSIKEDLKTTIVIISHQLNFLENLADELIFLHNKVVKKLSSSDLYNLAKRPLLEISCAPVSEDQIKNLAKIDPNLQVNQKRDLIRITLSQNSSDQNDFISTLIGLNIKIKQFVELPISPEQLYKKIIQNDSTN